MHGPPADGAADVSRPSRVTCAKHRRQIPTAIGAAAGAAAVWIALAQGALGIGDRLFNHEPEPAPSTATECADDLGSDELQDMVIDSWLCDTQFANIWVPDMQHGVLWDNRPLLEENYPRVMHTAVTPGIPMSDQALADPDMSGGAVSRLYAHWPTYQTVPSVVLGQVRGASNIVDDTVSSDWVIQLGTVREEHQLLYVRVVGPPGWAPPTESECALAIGEVLPIARGYVPRADADGTYDVIYAMAATFDCFPLIGEEAALEFRDALPPELQDAFDDGASLDRW